MLVDIFIAPAGPFQAPKMEPVVPNLMSASVGSSPASAGDAAVTAAVAALETRKWRRFSMAFPFFCCYGYFISGLKNPLLLLLGQKSRHASWRCSIKHAVMPERDAFAGFRIGNKGENLAGPGAADVGAFLAF